jgi:hypothetical protein
MEQLLPQNTELEGKRTQVIEKMQKFIHTDKSMKFLFFVFSIFCLVSCQDNKVDSRLSSASFLMTWDSLFYATINSSIDTLGNSEKRFIRKIKRLNLHKKVIDCMDSTVVFEKGCGVSLVESEADEDGSYNIVIKLCKNDTIYSFSCVGNPYYNPKLVWEFNKTVPKDSERYPSMMEYHVVPNKNNKSYCEIFDHADQFCPTVESYVIIN